MKQMAKAKRIATGRVFQKSYKDRSGNKQLTETWYIKYYSSGNPVEMSTGTTDYNEALAMLRERMAKAARYGDHGGRVERVRMGHLLDMLLDSYRVNKRRSLYDTELRIEKHIRPAVGNLLAHVFGTAEIRAYVLKRSKGENKASQSTINKELAWLRHAMRLGQRETPRLVDHVPHFPIVKVDNARSGVLTHDQYRLIRDSLPKYARLALVIAYHTGARKGEIVSIRRADVDLKARRILRPGSATKNGIPRYLPIYGDMVAEIEMAMEEKSQCLTLIHRRGERVFDFEKVWRAACIGAGVPGALFHDLRRTAVTNMIEAGLSEREAMEISGHKTRDVFDRYTIITDRRLKRMGETLGAHLEKKNAEKPQEPEQIN